MARVSNKDCACKKGTLAHSYPSGSKADKTNLGTNHLDCDVSIRMIKRQQSINLHSTSYPCFMSCLATLGLRLPC